MEKSIIDKRIIEWVSYLIENKIYKSEASFLKELGFQANKLTDAKKGKASFRAEDIGIIIMNSPKLNGHWIMTGEGNMLLSENNKFINDESLTHHLKEELKELKNKNEELNREVGRLEGQLKEIKKHAQEEGNATCAIASGSDLEK